jgi:hypothetical protein
MTWILVIVVLGQGVLEGARYADLDRCKTAVQVIAADTNSLGVRGVCVPVISSDGSVTVTKEAFDKVKEDLDSRTTIHADN